MLNVRLIHRVVFSSIAVAAGIAGVALLAFPDSTGRFFSWGLAPPPAAALAGGFYLASTGTYLLAAFHPWEESRGLAVASLGFTVPTLIATLVHLEVFDLSNPIAMAWLVIFAAAPIVFVAMLTLLRSASPQSAPLPLARRLVLAGLAIGFAAAALVLLFAPHASDAWLPFATPPMTGRFLGGWVALLAVLATWAAIRPSGEGRLALFGLVIFPLGGLVGAARSFGDLGPPGRRLLYMGVLAAVAALPAALLLSARRHENA